MDFLFYTLFFCGILFLFLLFLSYYAHDNYRVALLKENNACIIMTLNFLVVFLIKKSYWFNIN